MSAGGNAQEFQPVEMQSQPEEQGQGKHGAEPPVDPILAGTPPPASRSVLYPRRHEDLHDSRRYFVSRPGAFDQAMDDLQAHVVANMGETAHSFWLLTEIDHWNNEKERILVITDSALLICKYDFVMLKCLRLQRVPLGHIERITQGPFAFPERSLDKRDGEGLRIFWDSAREPTFLSRWNPWATDLPFATFMEHPVKHFCQRLSTICQIPAFQAQLAQAVQKAQAADPVPGKTSGVVVAQEPIPIQTYTGLMSFLGNRNKLGYSLARGSFGF